jgi:hypothetical protein
MCVSHTESYVLPLANTAVIVVISGRRMENPPSLIQPRIGDITKPNGACPGVPPLVRTFGMGIGLSFQRIKGLRIVNHSMMPIINSIITICLEGPI